MNRFLAWTLCSTLSLSLTAQQAPSQMPVIRAGTRVVVVDVTVTDRKGQAIHDLPQSAFTIYEDNQPQQITKFFEHSYKQADALPPQPPSAPGIFTNAVPHSNGPLNILVLDTLNTPVSDQMYVHEELERFVKHSKPGSQIAIMSITTQLNLLQSFTSDRDQLLQAVKDAKNLRGSPLLSAGGGGREANYTRLRMRKEYTNDSFRQLAKFLSLFPGRKNVIWFSDAFPFGGSGTSLEGLSSVFDMTPEFEETTYLFSMSQVAFYSIEAGGLRGASPLGADHGGTLTGPGTINQLGWRSQRIAEEQMVMRQMAEDAGGKAYVNNNNIAGSTEDAIANGSNYYTLDYRPSDHAMDGRYHHIRVKLNNPEYQLTYRRGYNASLHPDRPKEKGDASVSRNDTAPLTAMKLYMQRGAPSMTQILYRARLSPIGTEAGGSPTNQLAPGSSADPKLKPPYRNFMVTFSADMSRITTKPMPNGKLHLQVEFVALVYDQDCNLKTANSREIAGDFTPAQIAAIKKDGLQFSMQVSIPAKGDNYLRMGVHDIPSDRIGTLEVATSNLKKLPATPLVSELNK